MSWLHKYSFPGLNLSIKRIQEQYQQLNNVNSANLQHAAQNITNTVTTERNKDPFSYDLNSWNGKLNKSGPDFSGNNDLNVAEKKLFEAFSDLKNNKWNSAFQSSNIMDAHVYQEGPQKYFSDKLGHTLTTHDIYNLVYEPKSFGINDQGKNVYGRDASTTISEMVQHDIKNDVKFVSDALDNNVIKPIEEHVIYPLENQGMEIVKKYGLLVLLGIIVLKKI